MKTRVLHILPWITKGGVERRRANLAERYDSERYELKIVGLTVSGDAALRIQASSAELVDCENESLDSFSAWRKVAAEIRAFRPHILHGAVFEGNILAATLGTLLRVPVVILEETSEATNRSSRGHALLRTLTRAADRIVAISAPVANDLKRVTRVPEEKIALITNGVEPYEVPSAEARASGRSRFGFSEDHFVVGTMCRLVDDSHKRVSDMVRAMATPALKGSQVRLLVCGDGPTRPILEELAASLGVAPQVVFAGNLSDPQDGFAAMDLFAHVAAREGFGLAVAEAAFCALPIVTTGVGGIAEIVVADETALLVSVGATDEIAHALVTLMEDPTRRRAFGAAGRARALERFSAQRWVNDLESLYQELLKEKGLV